MDNNVQIFYVQEQHYFRYELFVGTDYIFGATTKKLNYKYNERVKEYQVKTEQGIFWCNNIEKSRRCDYESL